MAENDTKSKSNVQEEQFAYLPLPTSGESNEFGNQHDQGFKSKLKRKMSENPFVPIGLAATTIALTFGLYQMKTGNKRMSQIMMRTRLAAQGFTVCAILGGVLYKAPSK